jgi:hypothetical protein
MPASLNRLLLEDSLNDVELILDVFQEAGFELASGRVDCQANYLRELDQPPDFILSGFSMPQFGRAMRCDTCKSGGSIFRSLSRRAATGRDGGGLNA